MKIIEDVSNDQFDEGAGVYVGKSLKESVDISIKIIYEISTGRLKAVYSEAWEDIE